MLAKILGKQEQDYKLDNGYSFAGYKYHAMSLDDKPDGLQGNIVTNFKISFDDPLNSINVEVGKIYQVFFDQKGKVAYLIEHKESKLNGN